MLGVFRKVAMSAVATVVVAGSLFSINAAPANAAVTWQSGDHVIRYMTSYNDLYLATSGGEITHLTPAEWASIKSKAGAVETENYGYAHTKGSTEVWNVPSCSTKLASSWATHTSAAEFAYAGKPTSQSTSVTLSDSTSKLSAASKKVCVTLSGSTATVHASR